MASLTHRDKSYQLDRAKIPRPNLPSSGLEHGFGQTVIPRLNSPARSTRPAPTLVRIYRAESNRSDILPVDWTEDIKVTSGICPPRHRRQLKHHLPNHQSFP